MTHSPRGLISLADLDDEDVFHIVDRGVHFAGRPATLEPTLRGVVAGIHFKRTSTRTRTAFSSGALRLGAQIVTYGPADLQLNTGETLEDTGAVLGGMLDLLVARTAEPTADLRALAAHGLPVVNAMSTEEHPTQGLTDLTALQRHFGTVAGLKVLYLGEGNNTASALALAVTRYRGAELHVRAPAGYGIDGEYIALAEKLAADHGAVFTHSDDATDLPEDIDAIYTTRWQTTGTSKPDPDWRDRFAPFAVGEQLWQRYPKATFLHDLPAHRGEEVSAEVLDGPHSIAFDQAQCKLHSAMAVLEWCLRGRLGTELW